MNIEWVEVTVELKFNVKIHELHFCETLLQHLLDHVMIRSFAVAPVEAFSAVIEGASFIRWAVTALSRKRKTASPQHSHCEIDQSDHVLQTNRPATFSKQTHTHTHARVSWLTGCLVDSCCYCLFNWFVFLIFCNGNSEQQHITILYVFEHQAT